MLILFFILIILLIGWNIIQFLHFIRPYQRLLAWIMEPIEKKVVERVVVASTPQASKEEKEEHEITVDLTKFEEDWSEEQDDRGR